MPSISIVLNGLNQLCLQLVSEKYFDANVKAFNMGSAIGLFQNYLMSDTCMDKNITWLLLS